MSDRKSVAVVGGKLVCVAQSPHARSDWTCSRRLWAVTGHCIAQEG